MKRRGRYVLAAGVVATITAMAVIVASCASRDDVGSQGQRAEVTVSPTVVTDGGQLNPQSVSATWSRIPAEGAMYCAASSTAFQGATDGGPLIWFFSASTTGPYTLCGMGQPGCGACGGTTLLPPAARLLGNNPMFTNRSPTVAADGVGHVVYAGLADTDGDPSNAERVVAAVSVDGGQHFNRMVFVNDDGGDNCDAGEQKLPFVTFDTTTSPPELVVAWLHKDGACVRTGTVNASPDAGVGSCGDSLATINWLGPSHKVDHVKRNGGSGIGGLIVQAGEGAITIVYASRNDAPATCAGPFQSNLTAMNWTATTTFDEGTHWTDNDPFFGSVAFPWCVGDPTDARVSVGIRDFGFVRAGNGHYYAAVQTDFAIIRVFESSDKGGHWREFCASDFPDGGLGGPPQTSVWRQAGTQCPDPFLNLTVANQSVFWPTLAADGDTWLPTRIAQTKSRLAIAYNKLDTSSGGPPPSPFQSIFQGNTDPASPTPDTNGFQGGVFLQSSPDSIPRDHAWGEFMGIAVEYAFGNACGDFPSYPPSYTCSEAVFHPFVMTGGKQPGVPVGITTTSVLLTNP